MKKKLLFLFLLVIVTTGVIAVLFFPLLPSVIESLLPQQKNVFEIHNNEGEVVLTINPAEGIRISENLDYSRQYGKTIWGAGTVKARKCFLSPDTQGLAQITLINPQHFIDNHLKYPNDPPNYYALRQYNIVTNSLPFPEKKKIGKYDYYFVPPYGERRGAYEGTWTLNTDKGLLEVWVVEGQCAKQKISDEVLRKLLESIDLKVNIK